MDFFRFGSPSKSKSPSHSPRRGGSSTESSPRPRPVDSQDRSNMGRKSPRMSSNSRYQSETEVGDMWCVLCEVFEVDQSLHRSFADPNAQRKHLQDTLKRVEIAIMNGDQNEEVRLNNEIDNIRMYINNSRVDANVISQLYGIASKLSKHKASVVEYRSFTSRILGGDPNTSGLTMDIANKHLERLMLETNELERHLLSLDAVCVGEESPLYGTFKSMRKEMIKTIQQDFLGPLDNMVKCFKELVHLLERIRETANSSPNPSRLHRLI